MDEAMERTLENELIHTEAACPDCGAAAIGHYAPTQCIKHLREQLAALTLRVEALEEREIGEWTIDTSEGMGRHRMIRIDELLPEQEAVRIVANDMIEKAGRR
jgi:hypothetical protein